MIGCTAFVLAEIGFGAAVPMSPSTLNTILDLSPFALPAAVILFPTFSLLKGRRAAQASVSTLAIVGATLGLMLGVLVTAAGFAAAWWSLIGGSRLGAERGPLFDSHVARLLSVLYVTAGLSFGLGLDGGLHGLHEEN
jgi:hypothetical protein